MNRRMLWLHWVAANAFGEMLGLGLTFAVGVLVISGFDDQVIQPGPGLARQVWFNH